MKLSEREKTLLFLLGVVAVLVIGVNFILLPTLESYKKIQGELNEVTNRQIEVNSLLQKALTINQDLEIAREEMKILTEPFLQELDEEYVDVWLHKMAEGTGVEITAVTITAPMPQSIFIYDVIEESTTYPIKQYYQSINSDTYDIKEIEQKNIPNEQLEDEDSVLQIPISISVTGTNEAILKLINKFNTSDTNLSINNFELNHEDSIIHLTLYTIDKDKESKLDYKFKEPIGKTKIID